MVFTRLFDIPYFQLQRYPNEQFIASSKHTSCSTSEFIKQIENTALKLIDLGINPGDHIGLVSYFGSRDWFIIDMASMSIGAVVIPLYPNYSSEDLSNIIDQTDIKLCFCQDESIANQMSQYKLDKESIFVFNSSDVYSCIKNLLIDESSDFDTLEEERKRRFNIVNEQDLATIIFTSGSTGMPKGVMLSHLNIVSNIKSIITLVPITYRDTVASYLPLNHIFERMVVYTYMAIGASINFIEDPKNMLLEVQRIRPHYMSSVPRILETIYNGIIAESKKAKPLQKKIIKLATQATGDDVPWYVYPVNKLKSLLFDFLVYRRWRKALGGRIKGVVVGAAALNADLGRLYSRAGIPIKEGYGLTETSPAIAFNRFEPGGTRFGTVGIPIPGVNIKIDSPDDSGSGEILVKGPNVMLGYYNNQALTDEKIDSEGYFHTGDVGHMVERRFLKITDRKKNIYKTSSGRYVYPQKIEDALRSKFMVDQCMAIGFQKPYVSALIVPDFVQLKLWAEQNNVHWTSPLYMVINDKVVEFFQKIVDETNTDLAAHEKIRKFTLLSEPWSIDQGEYTPTLKLKRQFIEDKYKKEIDLMN